MKDDRRPLALTQGDPAGIGAEITLKAWLARDAERVPPFFVMTDPAWLGRVASELGLAVPIATVDAEEVRGAYRAALPVVPLGTAVSAEPGSPDPVWAASVRQSIERAVTLVRGGHAGAVVTNPISKAMLYRAGFEYPGHTEYMAALASQDGVTPRPVMMLWSEMLAVVPVTIHLPLSAVPAALTTELIVETGRILAHDLRERFGIASPRLAVAGLNPHAGENGALGREDRDIVEPAIGLLRAAGLSVEGPLPADTMFHARARARYDAALAMYHDQALVPIKTLDFDGAVNVTLGLPFVRTSPDHGTAFDIAGRGIARPDSLIAALRLADRLSGAVPRG